ncbi:hypothetical protein DL98DRAFT_540590 [Cadophora sp. DSE1049]|nr:hypothetical protein DL98DRAFT_540590 [Cadophora sp. DSE1049]
MEYEEQEAMAPQPEPSSTLVPSRPPAILPISPQQVYHEQRSYYQQEQFPSQQTYPPLQQNPIEQTYPYQPQYVPQQTYRPHPTNPVYPPSVPTATGHVCQLCVATDRFPIRPTRCPFKGEHIGLPHSQQHPPVVTTSSMHQTQVTHHSRFERVEFVEVQAEDGDDDMTQREFNGEDWTRDTSREEHVEYISDRRRGNIEEWMDRCIDERCPGWESVREFDIWARARLQVGRGAGDIDEIDGETEGDAWRMLDEVWRV